MKKIKINDIALINKANLNLKSKTIIRYLDTNNLTENKINQLQELKIGQDAIPSRARRKVETGTIIYSKVRPNLKHYGIIDNKLSDIIVSTGFTTIDIININEFNPIYIYYNLIQNNNTALLHTIAANNASSYPSLTEDNIKNFELYVTTNINEQNKIATLLSSLDKKIELNDKINEELEQMAKLLFDYWFVQFDFPDENGKPYKSSGGKMTYNPQLKREIPDGWEVTALENFFTFEKGKIPNFISTTQDNIHSMPYLTIEALENFPTEFCENIPSALVNNDILMVMDGASSSKIFIGIKGIIGSTLAKLAIRKDFISMQFLYLLLKKYESIFKIVNTGSTIPHANKNYINKFLIPYHKEVIIKFNEIIIPMINTIIKNKEENQQLAELRDWLLPMLMNGQVKIEE